MKILLTITATFLLSLTALSQSPATAVDKPKAINAPSVASIPVPAEEAFRLTALQQEATKLQSEFTQKMQALQAEWNLINARAAIKAKLTIEQLDSLVPESDGRGGFVWKPRKVEAAKVETPKEKP